MVLCLMAKSCSPYALCFLTGEAVSVCRGRASAFQKLGGRATADPITMI